MTLDLSALSEYDRVLRSNPEVNAKLIAKFDAMSFVDQCAVASAWLYGQHYQSDHRRAKDDSELYGTNT